MQSYIVPAGYGEIEYIEKRSRFIGRVWHIGSESDALAHVKEMREKHWDATHNVYAYSVKEGGIARFSDDGEPSGTSGMPVLNVFRSGGVDDFCCVVTRYFGGILLGAGGLVRAYSKSASMALDAAGRAELRVHSAVSVICSYPQFTRLKSELDRFGAALTSTEYGADVDFTVSLPAQEAERFILRVTELSAGTAIAGITGESTVPVRMQP